MTRNGDGLAALLKEYLATRGQPGTSSFAAFLRQRNPHLFSHHDCAREDYRAHVWSCRGLFVCRGCTAAILSAAASFVAALATRWPVLVSTPTLASIFVALLLASLAPLRATPRTALHDARRVALGALLGSAASYLLLADAWLPRAAVVAVYLAVLAGRWFVRHLRKPTIGSRGNQGDERSAPRGP